MYMKYFSRILKRDQLFVEICLDLLFFIMDLDDDQSHNSMSDEEFDEDNDPLPEMSDQTILPSNRKIVQVTKQKSCKRGIVYLGHIPDGMTVRNIRELLSKFGKVERIYLEKDASLLRGSSSRRRHKYVEGWVEFMKKGVAKNVAGSLNGTKIGGKRRTKFYESLWNIKYLKRFKWSHLAEQMAYEKALREQKLRLEIGRAKREATFYSEMIDRNRHKKAIYNDSNRSYKQRSTDEQIKQRKQQSNELDEELLNHIFK